MSLTAEPLTNPTAWRRFGMANAQSIQFGDPRLSKLFWSKVQIAESGCWLWTGYIHPRKYGYFFDSVLRRHKLAHRVAYVALVGPIDPGKELDHLCRTPACVNPAHLEQVTHRVNVLRGYEHRVKTHCPSGHPYAGDNLYIQTKKSGKTQRVCKACRADNNRRHRLKMKAERP